MEKSQKLYSLEMMNSTHKREKCNENELHEHVEFSLNWRT